LNLEQRCYNMLWLSTLALQIIPIILNLLRHVHLLG